MKTNSFFLPVILGLSIIHTTVSAQVTCIQPPSGLVSWWPGDGNANDIIDGNHGSLQNGATFATGLVGQAFAFDAMDDWIRVPSSATLNPSGSFSIDAWIFPTADTNGNIASKWGDGGAWTNQRAYNFVILSGRKLRFGISDDAHQNDAAFHRFDTPGPVLTLNAWNHVAAIYNQATGTREMYVNGVKVAERTDPPITVTDSIADFSVGATLVSPTLFVGSFPGLIDELGFFNRALSASEIQAIFNADSAGKCAANQPPIANAGVDQSVHPGHLVTLDGSGSADPDGNTPLSYAWEITSKPAGSTATLSNPHAVNPSFAADRAGDYTITLVVTDALGLSSAPDQALVSTVNTPPVADAGPDQAILTLGTTVYLDGSQSYDDDGDPFTYQWVMIMKPGGSAATLLGVNTATPSFIADVHGDYVISLVVTDSLGAVSDADTVVVSFDNVKPVADAGVNQAVVAGSLVTLDGSGSSDANLDPLTYHWSFVSTPAGSGAMLSSTTTAQTSFTADLPGSYVISLMVNDGFVNSDPSNVTVTAISVQNAVTQKLSEAISTINGLDPGVFKNANMKNALTNKLNTVLELVDHGLHNDALDKLENDILQKMNGCSDAGADNNDWLTDCTAQQQIYPKITQAITLLHSLM